MRQHSMLGDTVRSRKIPIAPAVPANMVSFTVFSKEPSDFLRPVLTPTIHTVLALAGSPS